MTGPSVTSNQFQRAMPVLEVTDVARSIAFYRDTLGFSAAVWGEPAEFAIMQRGTVSIALDGSERGRTANNQHWAAYIYVADVDALYEEFNKLGVSIAREIEDAHYGCRDFDIADPDGYILAFGQDLDVNQYGPGLGPDGGRDTLTVPGAKD